MGSVYLLLVTNIGSRLGFLLAAQRLFGWCTLMGLTWWIYGTIGMLGEPPHWQVKEVVYDERHHRRLRPADADLDHAHDLDTSRPRRRSTSSTTLVADDIADRYEEGSRRRSAAGRSCRVEPGVR